MRGRHVRRRARRDASFRKYAAYTSHMDAAIGRIWGFERMCEGARDRRLQLRQWGHQRLPLRNGQVSRLAGGLSASGLDLPFRGVKAHSTRAVFAPTLVSWRSRFGSVDHPVQVVDWMPTFTRMAGADVGGSGGMARTSGTWSRGRILAADRTLFWNFRGDRNLGVRHGDWKLIDREQDEAGAELYDIGGDPSEERDLIADGPTGSAS